MGFQASRLSTSEINVNNSVPQKKTRRTLEHVETNVLGAHSLGIKNHSMV